MVAKGYSQVEGVDYGEIFSFVVKMKSIRFFLSIVAAYDLEVEKMDVKTNFLHGDLEEDIYMTQPEHYVVKGKNSLVCKLKRYLYGLKKSPGMWYKKNDTYVLSLEFEHSKSDHYVYYKIDGDYFLFIALYVDDIIFIGREKGMISKLKSQLVAKFEMKDIGAAKHILGMEIRRDRVNINLWLGQSKYVNSILHRFCMQDCRPLCVPIFVGTKLSILDCPTSPSKMEDMSRVSYQSAVGSLMYAMVCTRPDISQAVHWDA